jgi:type I restriction enzyme, S subunit
VSRVAEQIHTVLEEDLPSGWSLATIDDLIGADGVFMDGDWVESKDQDPTGDVRLIQLADIGDGGYRNKSDRFLTHEKALELGCTFLMRDDVLIARMPDPLGRACIFPGDPKKSVTVVDVAIVRSGSGEFNHRWLMYFINAPVFRTSVASLQSGSTRKRISRGNLARIALPVPPREQQNRIVAEIEKQFSRLDEAIGNLKRVKANLKRYKATILKAAVEGKLTEDWRKQHPDVDPASKLLQNILAQRRARWAGKGKYKEPTGPDIPNLPGLPPKWTWATMPQLGELNRGKSKHRPRNDPRLFGGRYPFIQTGDVRHSGGFIRSHSQTYNEVGLAQSRLWPAGTLCITIAANIAETGILTYPACFPDSVVGFTFNNDPVTVQFVGLFFRTEKDEIARYAPATAQKNINLEILVQIAVPFPPLSEQHQIVAEVERRLSVIEKLDDLVEASLKRSEHVRRSMLERAFEGKLVPAIPTDEPANVLLERLRTRIPKVSDTLPIGLMEVAMVKRRFVDKDKQPIIHVLKQAKRWLSTADLLAEAGYPRDVGPDDMEVFYLELKKELQALPRTIEIERRSDLDYFRAV